MYLLVEDPFFGVFFGGFLSFCSSFVCICFLFFRFLSSGLRRVFLVQDFADLLSSLRCVFLGGLFLSWTHLVSKYPLCMPCMHTNNIDTYHPKNMDTQPDQHPSEYQAPWQEEAVQMKAAWQQNDRLEEDVYQNLQNPYSYPLRFSVRKFPNSEKSDSQVTPILKMYVRSHSVRRFLWYCRRRLNDCRPHQKTKCTALESLG